MRFKKTLSLFLIIISLFLVVPNVSAISLVPESCYALDDEGISLGCSLCDFITLFINAADILVGLSGTFSILMFVYGGIVIITAYGNDSRIKRGKDIITATVVGVFIVLFAWVIINLVIGALFGTGNSVLSNWYNVSGVCSQNKN